MQAKLYDYIYISCSAKETRSRSSALQAQLVHWFLVPLPPSFPQYALG